MNFVRPDRQALPQYAPHPQPYLIKVYTSGARSYPQADARCMRRKLVDTPRKEIYYRPTLFTRLDHLESCTIQVDDLVGCLIRDDNLL